MDQLKPQARLDPIAGPAAPAAEQVPGSQPQMFGNQQPEADQVSRDLVGQKLPHAAFQAGRIAGFAAGVSLGPLGVDRSTPPSGGTYRVFF